MGLKLATGTIGFQDAIGLQRMYETIEDTGVFTHKLYVDGPIEGVKTDLQHSNDSTFEVARSFNAEVERMSFATEFDMRMKYLEMCRRFSIDFLFIIDTDEYLLRADGPRFLEHLESIHASNTDHNIMAVEQLVGNHKYGQPLDYRRISFTERPRVWYKPGDMTYVRGSHAIFKNMHHDNYYYPGTHRVDMHAVLRGIWLAQDQSYRTTARQQMQDDYEKDVLSPKEEEIVRMQAIENLPGLFF